ncbi:MAG: hypothetical protein IJB01_01815 [Bacteroidaceae bacterium]|nr:hypothetical protein [Bacteroidaceae bacterium]
MKKILLAAVISVLGLTVSNANAQETNSTLVPDTTVTVVSMMPDSAAIDSIYRNMQFESPKASPDSSRVAMKRMQNNRTEVPTLWKPDPVKATWLALIIPGGGQIYNRKYWKLPIVYGGFVGCLYAYNWNGQMYKDYRQAYLDIMDSDPNTNSYEDFFRPGYDFEANKEYLKEVFKKRKDRYRRWRDMSIFAFIGVYAVSVIDAYVDAQLSSFDITEDINLTIEPQRIKNDNIYYDDYYGLNFNITF